MPYRKNARPPSRVMTEKISIGFDSLLLPRENRGIFLG